MNHPGGCLGFRIENEDSVFAYCSDVGHDDDGFDPGVLKLAEGADLLVHDSHFATLDERNSRRDWGHSTWLEAAQVAVEARVKNLALFHFSPDMTDSHVEQIASKARNIFPRTLIAREGLELNLPLNDKLPD
jgi:ribonuclease BN (tRNA processing enzyme)